MMTDVHATLQEFWSGVSANVPAYVQGHVPAGTPLPYITYEPINGNALTATVTTAICWVDCARQDIEQAMSDRADILDDIADAIPPQGVKVPCESGYMILRRNASWQSYYDDPNDHDAIGGRTAYEIEYKTI